MRSEKPTQAESSDTMPCLELSHCDRQPVDFIISCVYNGQVKEKNQYSSHSLYTTGMSKANLDKPEN